MATVSYPYSQRNSIVLQIMTAFIGGLTLFLGVVLLWTIGFQLLYAGRIFPGVSVAGVDLSGLAPTDAANKLSQTLSYPYTGKIVLRDGGRVWVVTPAQMGMAFDASSSAQAAYQLGRSGGLLASLDGQVLARSTGVEMPPVILFDQRVAYQYLQALSVEVDQQIVEASLKVEGTNVVAVPGQAGRSLDVEGTLVFLSAQMQTFRDGEVPLVIREQTPELIDVSAQAEVARRVLSQPMRLYIANAGENDPGPWTYDVQILAKMLIVHRVGNEIQVALDPAPLREILTGIATQVDRKSENARFYFDDNTRQLALIQYAQVGRVVDTEASIAAINDALLQGEHNIALRIVEEQPAVTDNSTAGELGITELVSSETSYFYGSSAERIQNIQAAASRFHGVLVAPGETFSMGDALGDVSLDNGFAEALIIYGGRTIKGVGGGVCQVSTTLFRTVFYGGYPVVERYSHAYRVSYYEQTSSGAVDSNLAGLDATVYFPLVDFKFTNDTPYWLLMETYVSAEARTLTWKMYSTSEGRSVTWETTGPQNVVPAPEPRFEESDELKAGQIRQVDWAANGADVTVTRTVLKNGAVYFNDEFKTHYEPWRAVCEVAPGTEDPERLAERHNVCRSPST
ncbi:MAG: VanW family protein [Anaerolineales bacterium]|nr:VanW family protein [Anaerolineales bacterium]